MSSCTSKPNVSIHQWPHAEGHLPKHNKRHTIVGGSWSKHPVPPGFVLPYFRSCFASPVYLTSPRRKITRGENRKKQQFSQKRELAHNLHYVSGKSCFSHMHSNPELFSTPKSCTCHCFVFKTSRCQLARTKSECNVRLSQSANS